MDYLMFVIYSKSTSVQSMKYQAIFELLEGKIALPTGEEQQKRKRPESSSPPKLKDRNKGKLQQQEEESENYEDEFDQMVSHEDDEKKVETMQVKED